MFHVLFDVVSDGPSF